MGMYTECIIKVDCDSEKNAEKLVELIPSGCSSYHHPEVVISRHKDYVFARFDIKNYWDGIENFLNEAWPLFSKSYKVDGEYRCVGWYWYEEEAKPSLILCTSEGWELSP